MPGPIIKSQHIEHRKHVNIISNVHKKKYEYKKFPALK